MKGDTAMTALELQGKAAKEAERVLSAAGTEQMVYVTHTVNVGQTLTNK